MLPIYLSPNTFPSNHFRKHHMHGNKLNSLSSSFIEEKLLVTQILSSMNKQHAGIFSSRKELPTNVTAKALSVLSSPVTDCAQQQPQPEAPVSSKWNEGSRSLGFDFLPGPYDVICGRGKASWNHSGNRHFRALVKRSTEAYSNVKTRAERSTIVSAIVDAVRVKGNGFVKREDDVEWIEVGDLLAREKIGQMLRNSLSNKYRSSIKSKKRRRRGVHAKRGEVLHDVMVSNTHIAGSMETLKNDSENCALSDAALLALFTQQQQNMLMHIQADDNLTERFLQAEVSAALIMVDTDGSNSEGDVEMKVV